MALSHPGGLRVAGVQVLDAAGERLVTNVRRHRNLLFERTWRAAQQLVGGAPGVRVSNEPHRALAEGGPIAVDNVVGSSGPKIV
jgi:hypothetical protein